MQTKSFCQYLYCISTSFPWLAELSRSCEFIVGHKNYKWISTWISQTSFQLVLHIRVAQIYLWIRFFCLDWLHAVFAFFKATCRLYLYTSSWKIHNIPDESLICTNYIYITRNHCGWFNHGLLMNCELIWLDSYVILKYK